MRSSMADKGEGGEALPTPLAGEPPLETDLDAAVPGFLAELELPPLLSLDVGRLVDTALPDRVVLAAVHSRALLAGRSSELPAVLVLQLGPVLPARDETRTEAASAAADATSEGADVTDSSNTSGARRTLFWRPVLLLAPRNADFGFGAAGLVALPLCAPSCCCSADNSALGSAGRSICLKSPTMIGACAPSSLPALPPAAELEPAAAAIARAALPPA